MRINEQRYRYVFGSPAGPVGRYLGRVGARAESAAKVIATQEKLVRSGRYRASISWRSGRDGRGLFVEVGSALPHASLLEHGTPPHLIPARNKKALWWDMPNDRGWLPNPQDRYGNVHPVPRVNHPGTRAYNVIGRAIRFVVRGGIA